MFILSTVNNCIINKTENKIYMYLLNCNDIMLCRNNNGVRYYLIAREKV